MSQRKLQIGDVFKTDRTLYSTGGFGNSADGVTLQVSQHFSAKSKRPSPAPQTCEIKGIYVVSDVRWDTNYTKLYCATERELQNIIDEQLAERNVVVATKLKPDGSFDPKGQRIIFSQDRDDDHYVGQVKLVGKMRQTFVPVGKLKK